MNENREASSVDKVKWFESQKALLYDYLARMIGQFSQAETIMLEAIQVVSSSHQGHSDPHELKLELYTTARRFSADHWNANSIVDDWKHVYEGANQRDLLISLEDKLLDLSHVLRELLLLRYRYGFAEEEVAKIVGINIDHVEASLKQGWANLRSNAPTLQERSLQQLVVFQVPSESYTTVGLGELFEPPPFDYRGFFQSVFWLIASAVLIFLYWNYG